MSEKYLHNKILNLKYVNHKISSKIGFLSYCLSSTVAWKTRVPQRGSWGSPHQEVNKRKKVKQK